MNLIMAGINFKTAPLEIREKFSFSESKVPEMLQRVSEKIPSSEIVLLSTCNRTELYFTGSNIKKGKDFLIDVFQEGFGLSVEYDAWDNFYIKENLDAVKHLMAVASSLDSMVVGETEVLGQVKKAYFTAVEFQASRKSMHLLFQKVFRAAKRVHTETDICRGRVSVSSIAVEFAEKVFEDLSAKNVMIIGAGDTGELTLKSLIGKGVKDVLVLNRSIERGKGLADKYGGKAIQFNLLDDYLPRADIVISSTNAPRYIIHADRVSKAVEVRHGRPILLIDIAVPRDIDPDVGKLENVYLYDIDDLQRVAEENMEKREESVEKAWKIVKQESEELVFIFGAKDFKVLMKQFDKKAREIKEHELKRAFAKEKIASLPEEYKEEIDIIIQKTINKVLAAPRNAINEVARNGHWETYAKVVRHLFGLEEDIDNGKK